MFLFFFVLGVRISKKANFKDKKYGFGGRKKRSKYNTAESYAEAFVSKDKKGQGAKSGRRPPSGHRAKLDKKFMNKNKPKKQR